MEKQYVGSKLHRDDINCSLLLRRGVDPSSRRTLAFKVEVPSYTLSVDLDKTFWPPFCYCRIFDTDAGFTEARQRLNCQLSHN